MFSKYIVPALCATNLLGGVEAAHRHKHLHKKDMVYAATEVQTITEYYTVTVYDDEDTATEQSFFAAAHPTTEVPAVATSSTSTSTSTTSTSSTTAVVVVETPVEQVQSTTLSTAVKTTEVAAAAATTEEAAAAAVTTPVYTTAQAATTTKAAATTAVASSGVKRGLAYNDATLVSTIVALASSKFSWAYNWGADSGSISGVSFIPMLWGPGHYGDDWVAKAKAAVSAGTEALLSFNECDNAGQCNMGAADTAKYHKQYMNIYDGQIRIGAPAISSSQEANQGLDWLSQFFTACNGGCSYDFCNIHWYGPGDLAGANEFLAYLITAQAACGKNLWVTEFASVSGDASVFMKHAIDQLDNNSTFSFVEKYSYFMLSTGSLFDSSTALSTLGNLYIS